MRWFVALVTAACLWAAGGTPRDAIQLRDRHAAHIGHAAGGTPNAHARRSTTHQRARVDDPFVLVGAQPLGSIARVTASTRLPARAGLVTLPAPSPVSRGPPRA
jgi:hypothetical protein